MTKREEVERMVATSLSPDQHYMKRNMPVTVEFAASTGSMSTLEGAVGYSSGDAILTGIAGERWPVPRATFLERYVPVSPTTAGQDGAYVKAPMVVTALSMPEAFRINIARGVLTGKAGDWLVTASDEEQWIVAADVFAATYELANGPGTIPASPED